MWRSNREYYSPCCACFGVRLHPSNRSQVSSCWRNGHQRFPIEPLFNDSKSRRCCCQLLLMACFSSQQIVAAMHDVHRESRNTFYDSKACSQCRGKCGTWQPYVHVATSLARCPWTAGHGGSSLLCCAPDAALTANISPSSIYS
jgi:hypothetical protein